MNLKNQVVSLELAKKLKELGVKQKSLWYWNRNFFGSGKWYLDQICIKKRPTIMNNGICSCCYRPINRNGECDCSYWDAADNWGGWKIEPESYSAFTVAELGEILPDTIDELPLIIQKIEGIWQVKYIWEKNLKGIYHSQKLADAMAKILIYLIENKLIKV